MHQLGELAPLAVCLDEPAPYILRHRTRWELIHITDFMEISAKT